MKFKKSVLLILLALVVLCPRNSYGDLIERARYIGKVGYSTDGMGVSGGSGSGCNSGLSGTISASVPIGATVIAAHLYTQFFSFTPPVVPSVTMDGYPVTFGPNVLDPTACCGIGSARADVTDIVKPVIDGGSGGTYNFTITELTPECNGGTCSTCENEGLNGEALVVVYSLSSLVDSTVIIYDGYAEVTGSSSTINFSTVLHPGDAGFIAEMAIGIGFSCCGQRSDVEINNKCLSKNAGNYDDGQGYPSSGLANGNLITVGGFNDTAKGVGACVSGFGSGDCSVCGGEFNYNEVPDPTKTDHEKYNIKPFISDGDTSITLTTKNGSQDDNVFFSLFYVTASLFKCAAE